MDISPEFIDSIDTKPKLIIKVALSSGVTLYTLAICKYLSLGIFSGLDKTLF